MSFPSLSVSPGSNLSGQLGIFSQACMVATKGYRLDQIEGPSKEERLLQEDSIEGFLEKDAEMQIKIQVDSG
jgi:hypothetical protein